MTPRTILAVTDFSSHGDNALRRAALLSAEHHAALRLVHIAHPGDTPPEDAATRLTHHARQLAQVHGIPARALGRTYRSYEELRTLVSSSDLVVWGTAPVKSLRAFFLGQPVEAFVRRANRPVLVVRRRASDPYQRLLVAVGFTKNSASLVNMGFALSKTASVELFHAVNTANEGKLRHAEVSTRVLRAYREECRRYAVDRMFKFTDSFDTRRNRVQSTIAHGDPARQILVQQERSGSDLIIVGRHLGSTFWDLLLGSVSGRLLSYPVTEGGRADILAVPHGWQSATSAPATSRLAVVRPEVLRVRAGPLEAPRGPDPAARRAGT